MAQSHWQSIHAKQSALQASAGAEAAAQHLALSSHQAPCCNNMQAVLLLLATSSTGNNSCLWHWVSGCSCSDSMALVCCAWQASETHRACKACTQVHHCWADLLLLCPVGLPARQYMVSWGSSSSVLQAGSAAQLSGVR